MPKNSSRMFSKPKSWLSGSIWRPKNPHSLEHLKFLYNLLCKNQTVTEQNRALLVETLRSISEILIWGDQNDSSVFDFFLEKNMLSFFLKYLQQRFGHVICVQLLQTLNILFENISNETSLYYLLSNNHINSIIIHKFDFSDEEVMAYYISFLKTLSLKLNKHTIHFFYNEHTNDFALYTEAIKFFNHTESMVRIAVRTITLNVFRVDDKAMLSYIRNRTAAPYFSNLVWFIGNHILDLDACVRHDHDHRSRDRLADLVAEHLDHLHYLNDIFLINIHTLNEVLTDKLLNRLLIPLYVYSLTKRKKFTEEADDRKHVSCVVSLFLLSQVFLIIRSPPLVQQLAEVIFQGDMALAQPVGEGQASHSSPNIARRVREFRQPRESLEKTLENTRPVRRYDTQQNTPGMGEDQASVSGASASVEVLSSPSTEGARSPSSEVCSGDTELSSPTQNSTDEEKLMGRTRLIRPAIAPENPQNTFTLDNKPYLESIFLALECSENDYAALFALCLLYAVGKSDGVSQTLLDSVLLPTDRSARKDAYNLFLVERLIRIIELACQSGNKVRLATLEMSIKLLKLLVNTETESFLQDRHLACIENAKECCTQMLRNFYKSEEIFLDMFEDEYREMKSHPLNVEYMMQDASILLPPTGTPLTGINFNKRLPCGEVERARKAIRVFFLVRDLSLTLLHERETQLPLTKENVCIKTNDVLDLNNSDLIACTVTRESRRQLERRFLVIDPVQLILVEPDSKRLGWGVVKFVGFLQDVEVTGDKDDSRLLHVIVHKPQSTIHAKPVPILAARFVFDDHIRCMAAKQRLIKGRQRARQQKMTTIERLLDIAQDMERGHFTRSGPIPGRSHPVRVDTSGKSSPINIPRSSSPSAHQQQQQQQAHATTTTTGPPTTSTLLAQATAAAASKPTRRVTPEQRKMLQAKAAQRSKSRQQQNQQQQLEQDQHQIGGYAKQTSSSDTKEVDGSGSTGTVSMETNSASAAAALSLNNTRSSSSDIGAIRGNVLRSAQLWPVDSSSSSASSSSTNNCNNSFGIPMEDLSHSRFSRGRAYSSDRSGKPLKLVSQRDMFKFQRSLSHSPSRSIVKNPDTSAILYSEKYEATRRLSAPGLVIGGSASQNRHIPTPVAVVTTVSKVSTATQVGRTYTSQYPKELSGSSTAWAEKTAAEPTKNIQSSSSNHHSQVNTAAIPQRHHVVSATASLIPSAAGGSSNSDPHSDVVAAAVASSLLSENVSQSQFQLSGVGARPKQTLMGPPPPPAPPLNKISVDPGVEGRNNIIMGPPQQPPPPRGVQDLSLQGLQLLAVAEGKKVGANAAAEGAISPETPSSDSAVSSDASMISLSSMAGSESSMDVDSDNNAAMAGTGSGAGFVGGAIGGGGVGGAAGGRGGVARPPGSAFQQLTQLAQMVQEHYPYSSSPTTPASMSDSGGKSQQNTG